MIDTDDLNSHDFRCGMAQVAGAVSVVTVGRGAERTGLTVTSVTSVSTAPPTLLFCIQRTSSAWPVIRRHGCFGVNVLGASERDLADRFAGRTGQSGNDRYRGKEWHTLKTGAPIFADALAAFDCEVDQTYSAHTHEIVVGRVMAISLRETHRRPLIYWRRAYDDTAHTSALAGSKTQAPHTSRVVIDPFIYPRANGSVAHVLEELD